MNNLKFFLIATFSTFMIAIVFMAFSPVQQKPWVVPGKYKAMKNTVKSDAESIAVGKSLFSKHCKSCHGSKGKGDGTKAANLKTAIISFASKEYKAQAPGEKYYKSFIGRGEMPNFEKKITDVEDRWSIINYIDTFK